MPSSIPVDMVSPDQLPKEKGLSYDEISRVVGSLYLDSHHRISIMQEQFSAVTGEYEAKIREMNAQIVRLQKDNTALKIEVDKLASIPNTKNE